MKSYEEGDNKLNIYTIYFGDESFWEYFHCCEDHLTTIAKLGNTDRVIKEKDFHGLNNTLQKISKSFNPKLGIKSQYD